MSVHISHVYLGSGTGGYKATHHLSFPAHIAGLAQSVERQALNLMVVGSIPTFGARFFVFGRVDNFFVPHET